MDTNHEVSLPTTIQGGETRLAHPRCGIRPVHCGFKGLGPLPFPVSPFMVGATPFGLPFSPLAGPEAALPIGTEVPGAKGLPVGKGLPINKGFPFPGPRFRPHIHDLNALTGDPIPVGPDGRPILGGPDHEHRVCARTSLEFPTPDGDHVHVVFTVTGPAINHENHG